VYDTDALQIQGVDHRLRLTVSGVAETVRPTAARARAAVEELLAPARAEDFESAVAEALANAVEHGNGPGAGAISVKVDAMEGWIVARIRDAGYGNLANGPVDLLADPRAQQAEDERGRGLEMMRRLVDEVEVVEHADGRVVQLRMRTGSAAEDAADSARS
jgi:anti-sigma regulatory factor (Ser/Thr protein kinase)